MDNSNFVIVGQVVKPHGLKGEICVTPYTDSPLLFETLNRIYLRVPGRFPKRYTIENVRYNREKPLLSLQEVSGRDQAKELGRAEILLRRKDLPEQDTAQILIRDLVGVEVFEANGQSLGLIQEVRVHAGQEIWVIAGPNKQEILFPVVDQFLLDIDVQARWAIVDPPPGLLELNQG